MNQSVLKLMLRCGFVGLLASTGLANEFTTMLDPASTGDALSGHYFGTLVADFNGPPVLGEGFNSVYAIAGTGDSVLIDIHLVTVMPPNPTEGIGGKYFGHVTLGLQSAGPLANITTTDTVSTGLVHYYDLVRSGYTSTIHLYYDFPEFHGPGGLYRTSMFSEFFLPMSYSEFDGSVWTGTWEVKWETHQVPDAGTTFTLLLLSAAGLVSLRRRLMR